MKHQKIAELIEDIKELTSFDPTLYTFEEEDSGNPLEIKIREVSIGLDVGTYSYSPRRDQFYTKGYPAISRENILKMVNDWFLAYEEI